MLDNTGESVIGASVKVLGTKMGTVTDMDGKFTLANVAKGATIEISYIGYTPQQVKFNGTPLTITLKEDAKALDEVVVMGYGVAQKRAKVTNSIAKVSEKTLTVGANANPAQALAGAVLRLTSPRVAQQLLLLSPFAVDLTTTVVRTNLLLLLTA